MARLAQRAAHATVLAALCGCTVGPIFQPPAVQVSRQFATGTQNPDRFLTADPDPEWWNAFGDTMLSSLIGRLANENLDLKTAAERILQGRSERDVVAAQGLPHFDEKSSYERDRYSLYGNPLALVVPRPGAEAEFDVFQNGLGSSWELDLFGRVRRGVEAANASTEAAAEDRNAVALAAEAELAQDYLTLRGVQAQLGIAEDNLRLAQRITGLVSSRVDFGTATNLELAQARAQEQTIAEMLPPFRARQAALINAIGLLLGQQPRSLEAELAKPGAQPAAPGTVAIGLPLGLVRRRPDLRRAEAKLHEAVARTGVATAEFYPDITLNGSVGLNSLRLRDAFSLYSREFQVGPSVSIPLFEGGRLRGTLRVRKSQQREAAIDFQQTLLRALRDVDDALTDYEQSNLRRDHAAQAVGFDQAALNAARLRYATGAADFLNVTTSQAALLREESELANSRTQTTTDLVALYRALGGGWAFAAGQAGPR